MEKGVFIIISKEEFEKTIIQSIRTALMEHNPNHEKPEDVWFDIHQLAEYLPQKPTINTIYDWTRRRAIPYSKATGRLIFSKAEIDAWLKSGKKMTINELTSININKK